MRVMWYLFLVTGSLYHLPIAVESSADHERKLERRKRYLAFPKGSSLQLVYCFLVAALGTQNIFTIGITLGIAWEIPTDLKSVLATKTPNMVRRRDARSLYPKLEGFLHRIGVNGHSCVMRAICEATHRNDNGTASFAEEITHSIFTFPEQDARDNEEEEEEAYDYMSSVYEAPRQNATLCAKYYAACPSSILDMDFIT